MTNLTTRRPASALTTLDFRPVDAPKATFHSGMLEVRLQKREPKADTRIPVRPV